MLKGFIFLFLSLIFGVNSENLFKIVEKGNPVAKIIISEKPTKVVQLAAYELSYHIKLITGAEIPILRDNEEIKGNKICVGKSKYTEKYKIKDNFENQEFLIKFFPDAIILIGKDKEDYGEIKYGTPDAYTSWPDFYDFQGTMYAVYEFLERFCGVEWFNPTDYGTIYPEKRNLIIKGKDIKTKPFFISRDVYPSMYSFDLYDWSTTGLWKGKINPNDPDYKRYMEIGYEKLREKYPKETDYINAKRGQIKLFLFRMRVGGEKYACNHSLYGYYDRFWEKNPNNPGLFEGKREEFFAKGYQGKPPQLCYTNKELIKQVAQDARDYYNGKKTGPQLGIFWAPELPNPFPVEPMDNRSYCKCDECQKLINKKWENSPFYSNGLHSNYFFNFVNQVAKELRKTHPDKEIITLAYSSHAWPPDFEIEPNVIIDFCFAANRGPEKASQYQNEINALNKWREKLKDRPIFLWLYYTFPKEFADGGNFYCFPGFFAHQIDKQFKMFKELNIKGMFHCGYGQEVEAYVTYKLMFNPDLNIEKLLDEYFKGLYGKSWKEMKEFYLLVEKRYLDINNYPGKIPNISQEISWGYLGKDEVMGELEEYLNKAKEKAENEIVKKRIEMWEKAIWAYMKKGKEEYNEMIKTSIPQITVPYIQSVKGDLNKVEWEKGVLLEKWYKRGSKEEVKNRYLGKLLYDDEYLYIELVDFCNTKKLQSSSTVFPYDDWEIFIAKQRALPYRQYASGPTGLFVSLSHGEINFTMNVPIKIEGVKINSDTKNPDKWITQIALPLKEILHGGLKKGEKFYMNIIRVVSPQISGKYPLDVDSFVSYTTVHQTTRLAEFILK